MVSVRYSPGRLLLKALGSALTCAVCVFVYFYPEWAGIEIWTMIFSDGIGHDVMAPAVAAFFAVFGWRATSLAVGSGAAVEVRDGTLIATTFWTSTKAPVRNLVDVRIERTRKKWRTISRLVLRISCEGLLDLKTVRIPLALTELPPFKYESLVSDLETLSGNAPRSADAILAQAETGDFDADAALARYMQRKQVAAAEAADAAPAHASGSGASAFAGRQDPCPERRHDPAELLAPTRPRPSFGRKTI